MTTVQASELQVIAGGGIAVPFKQIAAQFESASGHKLHIRFGTAPELIKMATSGVPFDLGDHHCAREACDRTGLNCAIPTATR